MQLLENHFIIDFDSTFITLEALDLLAEISLRNNPKKKQILNEIKELTLQGMEGKLGFAESLKKRLALFQPSKNDIVLLEKKLNKHITPSVLRNKEFFAQCAPNIYIISGGFKEYIVPIVEKLGLDAKNVLANSFVFNKKNVAVDYDHTNPASHDKGKIKLIKSLHLSGKIYVVGDGYTDYQVKEAGQADRFFAFVENIKREGIIKKADYVVPNFDELLYLLHLPRALSYPKNRIKALVLENIDVAAFNDFKREGYQVELIEKALTEKELILKIKDVSVLCIRSKTIITEKILESAPKLLAIGAYCIGTNTIDLVACAKRGVAVFNAPYSNTRSVVELAIAEIIMLSRRLVAKNAKMHKGIWDKSVAGSTEIRGKKLGIIGYGNIGSQLSVLAENLGMQVYYYNSSEKLSLGNAYRCKTMEELLRLSDVVTIHVNGKKENKNLISRREFLMMKKGVLFLNLSRGFVVDLPALYNALVSKKVAGAALDVFPVEPSSNSDPFVSQLQNMPNVILTPHIGGNTVEAQMAIAQFVTAKIFDFINNGTTVLSVNMPQLQLPRVERAHRLIHLHQNKPGILAKINAVLARNHINIEGQYLKTRDDIGYVITDVNRVYDASLLKELREIPETIKLRVLY